MSSSADLTHVRDRLLDSPPTERVTYRERDDVLAGIDALVDAGVYRNRSEALRAATRQLVASGAKGGSDE